MAKNKKKVMVSGCFDLFHAGHLEFLTRASKYGDLYVVIGTDENIELLKNTQPTYSQKERAYLLQNVKPVKKVMIATGSGLLDFQNEIASVRPDYFVVNDDGDTIEKRSLCRSLNAEYVVLKRDPHPGFPRRTSSALRLNLGRHLPYRLCLAGGWIDQPYVNKYGPGSVTVVQIEPQPGFLERSGLATSTRKVWSTLIGSGFAGEMKAEELAQTLFYVENGRELMFGYRDPSRKDGYLSGSQDHVGLTHTGVSRLDYNHGINRGLWPTRIESITDERVCKWLEKHLIMVPIGERPEGYDPLEKQDFNPEFIRELGSAGKECYDAIMDQDLESLGSSLTKTHDMWREILPLTTNGEIDAILDRYSELGTGRTTTGCGGGYAIIATDRPPEDIPHGFRIQIRTGHGRR